MNGKCVRIISKQLKDKITGINPEFLDKKTEWSWILIAFFIFGSISVRDENKPYKETTQYCMGSVSHFVLQLASNDNICLII